MKKKTDRHSATKFIRERYLLEMHYHKKNCHKVYNCPTMKIKTNIHCTLIDTLTCVQVLRNFQRQNNATIYEKKEIGAIGENKQE